MALDEAPIADEDKRVMEAAMAASLSGPDRWDSAYVYLAFGMPSVVGALHSDPDTRSVPEQLAEANGDGRGNWFFLVQDVIEVLTRDAEQARDLRLGPSSRRDHVLSQKSAGVRRATVRVSDGRMFRHWLFLSGIARNRPGPRRRSQIRR